MIPSLLQIPSAVSDSKLHSVLPNNGKGDFQFERSTGATRINRDGLIEEVGYFSSELVQNGNFSELGSELVSQPVNLTNDFLANSGGVIVDADTFTTSGGSLDGIKSNTSVFSLTVGKTYKIDIQGNTTSSGFTLGNISASGNEYGSGFGTHYFVSQNTQLWIRQNTEGTTNITSLSIKQVDPNDRWTLGGEAIIDNGLVSFVSASNTYSFIRQDISSLAASLYKISIEVKNYVSGAVQVGFTGSSPNLQNLNVSADGVYTVELSPNANGDDLEISREYAGGAFNFDVDNVSVVEVQGDRPRLSYDITNGVVDSQPHLLLEPSATNLITFSEDFSQWTLGSNAILTFESDIEAPDGTLGVYRLKLPATGSTFIQSNSFSSSNPLSVSIYAKATGTGDDNFNLYTGGSNISPLKTATDKWQRFEYTASGTDFFLINSGDSFITDIYIWGGQAEALSYATSLIPTAGTIISRSSETCNNSKPSVNSTEGVLYCEIAALANDGTFREITLNDGAVNNVIELRYNNVDNQIQFVVRDGGSVTVNSQVAFSDVLEYNKIAFQYKANDFKVFANGSEVATDTTGSVPSGLNQLDFSWAENNKFYGKVKGLAVYNEALSESQLFQLTGVTASSIYSNFVTRTASFTVEALNEVKKVIDNL